MPKLLVTPDELNFTYNKILQSTESMKMSEKQMRLVIEDLMSLNNPHLNKLIYEYEPASKDINSALELLKALAYELREVAARFEDADKSL
jgi:hypothetical protein